jgi:hypothetical protein
MPLDSKSYVERSSDQALFQGLLAGKYCYVLNSRQMGKSSLSIRILTKLEQSGVRTAFIDLTRIGGRNVTAPQWYAGLCDAIGANLGLRAQMLDYFRKESHLGPMQRFFGALEHVVLAQISGPVSLFFDEIDSTKNLSFQADEFFAGIRECYNRRVQDGSMKRLTFCLIGVAVPSDLISNPSTTPFNIGERIQLNDFTLAELQSWSSGLGPNGRKLVDRVHYWTAGQPFLSQNLCEAIASNPQIQDETGVDYLVQVRLLERRARTTNINLVDVGERALNSGDSETNPERFRAELLSIYEKAWKGGMVPDDEASRIAVILKLSGLMRSDGRRLVVRNRIYHEVFNRQWILDHMPERELLRERQAFRRGLFRAASVSALVIAVVCGLGLLALRSEKQAVSAKQMLDYELYVSDMNNMRLLEEIGDISRMDSILQKSKNSPYRGWEWGYWLGRIHSSNEEYSLDYDAPGKREEGTVSLDGKQVCVYDSLLGVAAVIDRSSRKSIFVSQIGHGVQIVATRIGFVAVISSLKKIEVKEIQSAKLLSVFTSPKRLISQMITRSRSEFGLVVLADPADDRPHQVELVELISGKTRFSYHSDSELPLSPIACNQSGTRVLVAKRPQPHKQGSGPTWLVLDTAKTAVMDSFEVPRRSNFEDFSDSGRLVLYSDPQHTTLCRDVDHHAIRFRRAWDGGDIAAGASITADDRSMFERFGTGRAAALNFETGQGMTLGENIWSLSQGGLNGDLLAASTSVRIINIQSLASGATVAQGLRISRDDRGGLAVFAENSASVSHYKDPSFQLTSRSFPPPRLRDGYPYNGLWRLTSVDDTGMHGLFTDVDGREPPIHISPMPINYSCGSNRDSLVVLERGSKKIEGISSATGKPRWTYNVPRDPIGGIWVSPHGDTALALSGGTDLLALDVPTGKVRAHLGGHNVHISNLCFTRDGKMFFTCGADGRVILWDLASLKMLKEFKGNVAQRTASADLSPDGSRVATCNLAGSWQLWDAKTGVQLMDIHGSTLPLRSILFTSDGGNLVTAGDNLQVRLWPSISKDPSIRIPVAANMMAGITQ